MLTCCCYQQFPVHVDYRVTSDKRLCKYHCVATLKRSTWLQCTEHKPGSIGVFGSWLAPRITASYMSTKHSHCGTDSKTMKPTLQQVQLSTAIELHKNDYTWWRHQMEAFPALLALCAGNSPVSGEFPAQRPMTRSFDVFFDLRVNKRLSKQSWGWWFETLSRSLWRHRNDLSRRPKNFQIQPRCVGKCSFAVCRPLTWNILTKEIRWWDNTESENRILKTNLFFKFINESVKFPKCDEYSLWRSYVNPVRSRTEFCRHCVITFVMTSYDIAEVMTPCQQDKSLTCVRNLSSCLPNE